MGKNNIRKGILRSLCAAVTAFAAAAVPVMGGTTFADTKDYDQEIAQLEQKALGREEHRGVHYKGQIMSAP